MDGGLWHRITTPTQSADLIDQLRASGAVLTHDPDTRTIRDWGLAGWIAVTTGHNRLNAEAGEKGRKERRLASETPATAGGRARVTIPPARKRPVMGI